MTEFKISSSDLKKDLNLDFKNLRQNIKLVQNFMLHLKVNIL